MLFRSGKNCQEHKILLQKAIQNEIQPVRGNGRDNEDHPVTGNGRENEDHPVDVYKRQDLVGSITHIEVRERIPDSVFDHADQVEVIDIEPEDLLALSLIHI